jgi:PAS domain S-box-containing protein
VSLISRSILARIVAYFLVLGSVVAIALGVVAYVSIARSARTNVTVRLQAVAAAKEQALDGWIYEREHEVLLLADLPDVRRAAAALVGGDREAAVTLRGFLRRTMQGWPETTELFVLTDPGGRAICSTTESHEGEYHSLDTYYVQGRRGTAIHGVYPSPVTLRPTITIATPLTSPEGAGIGVFAAHLDLDAVDTIVRDRTGLGPDGEAYLVDSANVLVSGTRFGSDEFPRGVHSRGIEAALSGSDGDGQYANHRGVPVIGVYRWLPQRRVALLVEIPADEAFRSARRQTALLVSTGLGLVLVLVVGVYVLGLRIARPILAVQEAARAVADGRLDSTVPAAAEDEIGKLGESFNRMTARLRELYAELRTKEEYFRSLIETSSDMIAVIDVDGRVKYASPSAERVTGFPISDFVGRTAFEFVHPDDAAGLAERLRAVVEGVQQVEVNPIVFRVRRADGGWRTVDARGRNMLAHPAIGGILVTARDVTEWRLLEERLGQAQKMEAVGRLAGGIAHDFNNLLTAILGYADLVTGRPGLDPGIQAEVAEIRGAAERAAGLTRQLLAFSRKQVLQPRVLDLNAVVADMQGLLRRLIGENIELQTLLDPALPPIRADRSQIEQVIINLSVNARDAMPDGGRLALETRCVTLAAADLAHDPDLRPGPYVRLAVSDTGHGMSPEVQPNVFDPFFTTKAPGHGTGLGLPTVLGIVKQSGGRIGFQSAPGRGTHFEIELPAAAPETEAETPAAPGAPEGGGQTILVVEDEQAVGTLIESVLARRGYRVRRAATAEDALVLAAGMERIDLLITDLVLPGMNGRELAERLSGQDSNEPLNVLFMSGYTEDMIARHRISSDARRFLQKPFAPSALVEKVGVLLAGR